LALNMKSRLLYSSAVLVALLVGLVAGYLYGYMRNPTFGKRTFVPPAFTSLSPCFAHGGAGYWRRELNLGPWSVWIEEEAPSSMTVWGADFGVEITPSTAGYGPSVRVLSSADGQPLLYLSDFAKTGSFSDLSYWSLSGDRTMTFDRGLDGAKDPFVPPVMGPC